MTDLVAGLSNAVTLGIVVAVAFCAAAGAMVVLAWAMGRRSR